MKLCCKKTLKEVFAELERLDLIEKVAYIKEKDLAIYPETYTNLKKKAQFF